MTHTSTHTQTLVRTLFVFLTLVAFFLYTASMVSAATTATLLPTGEGTNLSWTPKTGTTHYTMVDETTCNGTTDYVSETTVGDRDAYTVSLASVPQNATITNIALTPCASRNSTGSGSATLNVFYRYSGVASADAGAYVLPTGTTPTTLGTTNFGSLSLLKNSSSTLEIGAIYTAGTKGIRLSRMATVITYTSPTKPATPTSLTAVASSSTAFLHWTDASSNEIGFKIERSLDNVSFIQIATTTANVTGYTNTGLSSGTYYYKIRAYNAVGNSGYSSTTSLTLLFAPSAPTALNVFLVATSTKALVVWTDTANNETGFAIERSLDNVSFAQIATSTVAQYLDSGVSSGVTYYYKSRAYNTAGNSAYSNTGSVTMP